MRARSFACLLGAFHGPLGLQLTDCPADCGKVSLLHRQRNRRDPSVSLRDGVEVGLQHGNRFHEAVLVGWRSRGDVEVGLRESPGDGLDLRHREWDLSLDQLDLGDGSTRQGRSDGMDVGGSDMQRGCLVDSLEMDVRGDQGLPKDLQVCGLYRLIVIQHILLKRTHQGPAFVIESGRDLHERRHTQSTNLKHDDAPYAAFVTMAYVVWSNND